MQLKWESSLLCLQEVVWVKKTGILQVHVDKYLHRHFLQLVIKVLLKSCNSSNFRSWTSFALLESKVRSSKKGRFSVSAPCEQQRLAESRWLLGQVCHRHDCCLALVTAPKSCSRERASCTHLTKTVRDGLPKWMIRQVEYWLDLRAQKMAIRVTK